MIEDFRLSLQAKLINKSLNTCSRWATKKVWTPEPFAGPLSFKHFPWQPEVLNCNEPMVSVRKAAQMGFSVAALIKSLYMVDRKKTDVLYILPTQGLASDFAKARLDQVVAQSPDLRNMFIGTNNVGLKTTADHAHIFIRGSVAESGLVSVPVGVAIVDEYDRCAPDSMALVLERLSAHEKKHFFGLSTPTLPNHGIDEQYQLGTQEHFMFQCPSCSRTIELDWEDSIEIYGESATDPDCHRSYFKCAKCGSELPHETKAEWLSKAFWQATATAYGHRSFHINQMYGPSITPGEMVVAYHKGQMDDASQVQFTNQKMGLPYLMEGARLTDEVIDTCLRGHRVDGPRPQDASKQTIMGVDIGRFLDIVIAEYYYIREPGYEPHLNSICKVLWVGRMAGSDFGALDQLMAEWQVQYCCTDFQPETIAAKAFCRRFHGYASIVQYRRGTTAHEIKEAFDDDHVSILTVDRTAFLDMALGRIHTQRTHLPQDLPPIFREHVKRLTRTYEMDEMGRPKLAFVTEPGKADHLAHALALTEVGHLKTYSKSTGRNINPGEEIRNM